ncbi:MAG: PC4/YdbC family ssDNA-binding protein [Parvimonas sp.]|uniref:YdbC family protein n=1 Tax=Parvimonas sp. TaxID=1944660 RepID=UPI002A75D630|nr:PC4/YdbC family ssDNA-binding protein [Parvimonas sp.]MDY3050834.1 PC4/YdbC family ssDNA-binding protein [Parvimonas sp.]
MEKENFKIEKKKQTGEFEFIIEKRLLVLSITDGWSKELNLVGWNGNRAKFDIRDWNSTHERMKRGVTLKKEELKVILENADMVLKLIEKMEKDKII